MNIYDLSRENRYDNVFIFHDGRQMSPSQLWFNFKKKTASFLWEDKFYSVEIDDPLTKSEKGFIMSSLPVEVKRPRRYQNVLTEGNLT